MKHKGQLALGALLALSLIWAYRIAHPPPASLRRGGTPSPSGTCPHGTSSG